MKWRRREQSDLMEDRRGRRTMKGAAAVGGGGLLAMLVVLLGSVLGGSGGFDLAAALESVGGGGTVPAGDQDATATLPHQTEFEFMNYLIEDINATWEELYREAGATYAPAPLVVFTGSTDSGCGGATAAIGPHYCPRDEKVYIDLEFFEDLARRFGAPGDFAQAYVLAHEIGHHLQHESGIMDEVRSLQQRSPDQANDYSIRLELQADCLAGVWAHGVWQRNDLERGDVAEALDAAAAVGDDRIQQQATGMVNPETWTHGSGEQRTAWFTLGFETGDPARCDTFSS